MEETKCKEEQYIRRTREKLRHLRDLQRATDPAATADAHTSLLPSLLNSRLDRYVAHRLSEAVRD
jgi:hypothetical protein